MIIIAARWGKKGALRMFGPWGNASKHADEEPQIVAAAKNFFEVEMKAHKTPPAEAAMYECDCTGRHLMPVYEQYVEGEWK